MADVLNKHELADMLRFTVRQVDTLLETRVREKTKPELRLPCVRINSNVRFLKPDVDAWLQRLKEAA